MGAAESHHHPSRTSSAAPPSVRSTSSLASKTARPAATVNRSSVSTPNLISDVPPAAENLMRASTMSDTATTAKNYPVNAAKIPAGSSTVTDSGRGSSTNGKPDKTVSNDGYKVCSGIANAAPTNTLKASTQASHSSVTVDRFPKEVNRNFVSLNQAQSSAKNQEKGVQADFPKLKPPPPPPFRDGGLAQRTTGAQIVRPKEVPANLQNQDKLVIDPKKKLTPGKKPEVLPREKKQEVLKKENVASLSKEAPKNSSGKQKEENKQGGPSEVPGKEGNNGPKNEPPKMKPVDVKEQKNPKQDFAPNGETSAAPDNQNKENSQKETKNYPNIPKKEQKEYVQNSSNPVGKTANNKYNPSKSFRPLNQQNQFDINQQRSPPVWMTGYEPSNNDPWWYYGPSPPANYPYGWNYNKMKYTPGENPYEWSARQRDGTAGNSPNGDPGNQRQGHRSRAEEYNADRYRSQSLHQSKNEHVRFASPCSERGEASSFKPTFELYFDDELNHWDVRRVSAVCSPAKNVGPGTHPRLAPDSPFELYYDTVRKRWDVKLGRGRAGNRGGLGHGGAEETEWAEGGYKMQKGGRRNEPYQENRQFSPDRYSEESYGGGSERGAYGSRSYRGRGRGARWNEARDDTEYSERDGGRFKPHTGGHSRPYRGRGRGGHWNEHLEVDVGCGSERGGFKSHNGGRTRPYRGRGRGGRWSEDLEVDVDGRSDCGSERGGFKSQRRPREPKRGLGRGRGRGSKHGSTPPEHDDAEEDEETHAGPSRGRGQGRSESNKQNQPTNAECPICRQLMESHFLTLSCGHGLHNKCALQNAPVTENLVCPVCGERLYGQE